MLRRAVTIMQNILGSSIKQLRKERHLTQKELGNLTGFSQNTVSQHENGKRTLDDPAIRKYAAALNTTPQAIFDIFSINNSKKKTTNNSDIKRIISKNLKQLAYTASMTEEKIANGTDLSRDELAQLFNGISLPTAGQVQKLADFFGVVKSAIDPRFRSTDEPIRIGNAISFFKNSRGLTTEQLAEKIGEPISVITDWENGISTPDTNALQKMADIFQVSLTDFSDLGIYTGKIQRTIQFNSFAESLDRIVSQLDPMYQQRVYLYANEQLDNQRMASPDTLAAHQVDSSHNIDDSEAKNIGDYLYGEIDKYNSDK